MTYELAGIRLALRQDGKYIITKDGAPVYCGIQENPILAWRKFIDELDERVYRRIGDYLESQGRNRYTGELNTTERNDPA